MKVSGPNEAPLLYAELATPDHGEVEIFSRFGSSGDRSSFVIAQLGQSLDGRIATLSGDSKYINGREALRHLHRIRASVDAVLVGVGTVIADDPLLTVRLVPGRHPVRVVLDPRGRMPASVRLAGDRSVRTIILQAEGAGEPPPGCEVIRLPCENGRVCPRDIVRTLAAAGLRRILVEGGAHTISAFIDAGAVDRLHVLMAPMILGSGKPGLELAPIQTLRHALRPATSVHVLGDGNVLFDCDLRNSVPATAEMETAAAAE
jgi:riboflavin-specific deaminase-like protein